MHRECPIRARSRKSIAAPWHGEYARIEIHATLTPVVGQRIGPRVPASARLEEAVMPTTVPLAAPSNTLSAAPFAIGVVEGANASVTGRSRMPTMWPRAVRASTVIPSAVQARSSKSIAGAVCDGDYASTRINEPGLRQLSAQRISGRSPLGSTDTR